MAITGAVFEMRSATGDDSFGGGFNPTVTSPGTDWSQQNSAQVVFNGSTVTATTSGISTTILITGYTVLSTDVGNVLKVASGTNFVAQRYVIVSVNTGANTWTLDRNCTSGAGAAMVGKMGGAVATLSELFTMIADAGSTSANVSGATIWVKGTYTATASWAPTNGFPIYSNNIPFSIIGYSSSRGDNGIANWTTATNSTPLLKLGNNNAYAFVFQNIKFSNTAGTSSTCLTTNGSTSRGIQFINCEMTGFTTAIDGSSNNGFDKLILRGCEIHGNSSVGVNNTSATAIYDCYIHDNTSHGVLFPEPGFAGWYILKNTVCYNNGGSGLYNQNTQNFTQGSAPIFLIVSCAFVSNTGDGFKNDASGAHSAFIFNSIFYGNGGYGINYITNAPIFYESAFNAFGANSTAASINWPPGSDVTLSGDPFVGRTSANFALNNTAGAGAACRAAGFPGVTGLIGTGYADIGPLQHQDSGGGSTTYVIAPRQTRYIQESR